jgi:serine/threonine protein kinase
VGNINSIVEWFQSLSANKFSMTFCINPRCQNPKNSDSVQFCQSCGSELLLRTRYRAIRILGGGGFGKTYEIRDQGKHKVLKVLIDNSQKAVELFQQEAEVLSQLRHPGIPKVEPNSYFVFHPANSHEPVHCFVMELIEGMNLKEYLGQRGRPIDSDTAKRWLIELSEILKRVHEKGIIHRDIKPQNIILKSDGKLALIDFGAVKEGTGTEFATVAGSGGGTEVASHMAGGTRVVSAGYTAHEQMNGQAVKQSDLYSLGRTFIFLLTGKEPSQIPYDPYNDALKWRQYSTGVDPQLADLLDRMQTPSVKQRPANAQAVLSTLSPSVEDIEVELTITAQEAQEGTSKPVTFYRTVYSNGLPKQESKTLTVKIPAKSADGNRLRLNGQGNEHYQDGFTGNTLVYLNVIPASYQAQTSSNSSTNKSKQADYQLNNKSSTGSLKLIKRLTAIVLFLAAIFFLCLAVLLIYAGLSGNGPVGIVIGILIILSFPQGIKPVIKLWRN